MSSQVEGGHKMFQLRQSPLTGESEWIVVEEEMEGDDSKTTEALRCSLSATSYLDMLNDSYRNRAFRLAIEKTVTVNCHVLDIGAGTGLLSMMAARAILDHRVGGEAFVSACESYLPMVKLMRRVLRANGMERMVKVFPKRSEELEVGVDLVSRASMLVTEILDSELLGEGLIPTLQQAHDMLLTVNPKSVPYQATTYGQLVESTFLWKLHDLHGNEDIVSDGICLTPVALETLIQVKPQQYAIHLNPLFNEIHLLSEPFKIFEFDFWKRPDSHGEIEILVTPTVGGRVNAVVSWWVLQLDSDGSVFYSTAPKWIVSSGNEDVDHWCDHWKQCVWFIPGKGISVSRNANILLKAVHDDNHVSYSLRADKEACYNLLNSDECRLFLTPERIALYGMKEVRSAWFTAIKNALRHLRLSPLCLVADDSVLLTILAASLSRTSKVISSFHGLQRKGYEYLQAVSTANNFSMDHIQVLGKRVPSLLLEDNQREVDLFMAEPFYYGNDGMLPWHNLRFWKDKCMLDPILSKDAVIMPCKGLLRVCAMHLPDLWRSRCYLNEIEGFDHSVANETLGACGNSPPSLKGTCLSYFIWQCGEIKELSEVFLLMEFIFSEPMQFCLRKIKMEFSEAGVCHGFALWIDWVLDEHKSIILSTGPVNRYWKQGVKLLSKPVEVDAGSSVEIEASFDPFSGELELVTVFP